MSLFQSSIGFAKNPASTTKLAMLCGELASCTVEASELIFETDDGALRVRD